MGAVNANRSYLGWYEYFCSSCILACDAHRVQHKQTKPNNSRIHGFAHTRFCGKVPTWRSYSTVQCPVLARNRHPARCKSFEQVKVLWGPFALFYSFSHPSPRCALSGTVVYQLGRHRLTPAPRDVCRLSPTGALHRRKHLRVSHCTLGSRPASRATGLTRLRPCRARASCTLFL